MRSYAGIIWGIVGKSIMPEQCRHNRGLVACGFEWQFPPPPPMSNIILNASSASNSSCYKFSELEISMLLNAEFCRQQNIPSGRESRAYNKHF